MLFGVFAIVRIWHGQLLAPNSWLLANSVASCAYLDDFCSLTLLRPLIKRRRHNLCLHALSPNLHFDAGAQFCKLRRHIGKCNVLLEEWCWRPTGDVSDRRAGVIDNLVPVTCNATLYHLKSHERSGQPCRLRLLQGSPTEKLGLLHLAEAIQS